MNNIYRYQLEKYRGRGSRYVCPQCGRKYTFTKYIDTNNNTYVNDKVGKCNRLDKCGYHYTPRQYFEDNPWLREERCSFVRKHRENERTNTEHPHSEPPKSEERGFGLIPEWFARQTLGIECDYKAWLRRVAGASEAERIIRDYKIGGCSTSVEGYNAAIFWQCDIEGNYRTGKVMNYDPATGKRRKGSDQLIDWVHSTMRRDGALPEGWQLRQCLYGEHLLRGSQGRMVALAEGPKTAHIGSLLLPELVWLATDSMSGLSSELLAVLGGRSVVLFPDEGRAYEEWTRRIEPIAREVGFSYVVSDFIERTAPGTGGDIADLVRG